MCRDAYWLWVVCFVLLLGSVGCGDGGGDDDSTTADKDAAPTVSIDSPTDGTEVTVGSKVSFSATVSDDVDPPTALSIEWSSSIDGPLNSKAASAAGAASFSSSALSVGSHTITLTVEDSSSNQSSDSITLVVSEAPNSTPEALITSPESGSIYPSGTTVSLSGTVSDAEEENGSLSVNFVSSLQGDLGGSNSGGTVSLSVVLEDGTHEITLQAEDGEGETGSSSPISITISANEPPVVVITGPEETFYNEGDTVSLVATLSDDNTDPEDLLLEWSSSIDGALDCPATASSSGDAACDVNTLSPGIHTLTLTAIDVGGLDGSDDIIISVNGAPSAPEIRILPAEPGSLDDLTVSLDSESIDPNGDTVSYTYVWSRNGKEVSTLTEATVSYNYTYRGELWSVVVTPSDGELEGATATASTEIYNTPPQMTKASISPGSGNSSATYTCVPSGWIDVDGDTPSYLYAWLRNGEAIDGEESGSIVPFGLKHGDELTCEVAPYDGYDSGEPVISNPVVIQGREPSATAATISPASGGEETDFTCLGSGWEDADGDDEGYTYQWFVNGVPRSTESVITGEDFDKGDELVCEATPFDGYLSGESVESSPVTVSNTPPTVDGLAIAPDPAYVDDTLHCQTVGFNDADGDGGVASFTWKINGSQVQAVVSGGLAGIFVRGDVIDCSASVSDGSSEAINLKAPSLTISNSPPSITSVALNPTAGSADTTFTALPDGWVDADSDSEQYKYQWYVSGTATVTTQSITPGYFGLGDTLRVEVTPYDAYDDGETLESATITVGSDENPPSIRSVSLTPEEAYTKNSLTCTANDVSDPEGDDVTLVYEWKKNSQTISGATKSTLSGSNFVKADTLQCFVTPSDPGLTGSAVGSNKVTILNSVPTADSVAISPTSPTKASTLTCSVSGVEDADGDGLGISYEWSVNGEVVGAATGASLSSAHFDAGDEIICAATPYDDEGNGETLTSSAVTVLGTPPSVGSATLSPTTAYESSTFTCSASNITDIDGDEVTLHYAWYNGSATISGAEESTLTGESFDKGDSILCRITPEAAGESGYTVTSNVVIVQNSLPLVESVELGPSPAYETSTLTCAASGMTDEDGDTINLSYSWTVNTTTLSVTSSTLDGSNFSRGDSILCTVTPNDGEADGESVASNVVTITNSIPEIGSVALTPEEAHEDSRLECTPQDYSDADGDSISFIYSWLIDGSTLVGVGTPTLTGVYFDRGDEVVCRVTPADDVATGTAVDSNAVVIQNSAPTLTSVTLSPSLAYETTRLTCTPNGEKDEDEDEISFSYVWTVDDEVVSGASGATLTGSSFEHGDTVVCTVTPSDGISDGEPMESNPVTIENSPPEIESASLAPTTAYEANTLTCTGGTTSDDDPTDTISLRYAWTNNGDTISGQTTNTLTGSYFDKHDSITCIVTPYDGDLEGVPVESNVVSIQNTVPEVHEVSVSPTTATESTTLTCSYGSTSDDDGDTVTVSYEWSINGNTVSGQTTNKLTGSTFDRDDDVVCTITPTDDEEDGPAVDSNTVTIINEAPSIESVSLTPEEAYESSTLTCTANDVNDNDGDSVSLAYVWKVNGSKVNGATTNKLDGDDFDKGDTISCTVTPNDGYEDGGAVKSNTISIENTAPETTTPTVSPNPAYVTSTLTCSASGSDDDGDSVTLLYSWAVDGQTLSGQTGNTLSDAFVKGEQVMCTVTPYDGTINGTPKSSNPMVIQNTEPETTTPSITPTTAYITSTLTCNASGSDDDGDSVTLNYVWKVNGSTVSGQTAKTLSDEFVKNQAVTCTVTPYDGTDYGDSKTSSGVTIKNSLPVAETPYITPTSPKKSSTVTCNTTTSDADSDSVTIDYGWRVNGDLVVGADGQTMSGHFVKGDLITCSVTPNDGTADGSTLMSDAVTVGNTAPETTTPTLSPTSAYVTSTLTCSASGSDVDNDEVTLKYSWRVNNAKVSGESNSTLAGKFEKDDTVYCTVTPNDGTTDGTAKNSNEVTIKNTKPVITTPTLTPTDPYVDTTLVCSASASDDDDDTVTLTYSWAVNSVTLPAQTGQTLAGVFEKDDSVTCAVTPNDGSENGSSKVSNSVTILNTAPTITTPTISPSTAYVGSTLTCSTNASDKDSDSVSLSYVWKINGSTASGQNNPTLSGVFEKGDSVTCTVTPNDGEEDGSAKTSSPRTISNTDPSATTPTLSPTPAYVTSDIVCSTSTSDADGDSVSIGYVWKVNGSTVTGESSNTLGEHFSKGDSVTCTVTPYDGTSYGTAKTSAGLTISNSKPTASDVAISPSTAYADDTLSCSATTFDADGDGVTLSYAWKKNGTTVPGQTNSTLSGVFDKGDSITCTVTPNDGTANGTAKTSSAVEIQNSAPSATTPTLSPNPATVVSILSCSTTGSDIDDDTVTIAYAWKVNGSILSGQTSSTLAGQYEKGDSVTCTVTPNDGTINGTAKTSSTLTISNSPPEATKPTISPTSAYADDELTCSTSTNDEDGDSVAVGFVWKVNGSTVENANQNTLSGEFVKGNSVVCVVTPNDGTEDGDSQTSSAVTIKNSKPSATTPVISPNPAYADDTLTCETTTSDVDVSDTVTVTYSWMVNSVTVSETGSTLSGIFEKGDQVVCAVTPNDGTASGSSKVSSSVEIDNSAPTATTPTLSPTEAYADSTLTCSTTTDDVDGDTVTVTYTWLVNGSSLPDETSSTLSGAFSKGEEVKCKVTPFDGSSPGGIRTSAGVTILNSTPSATKPTITPSLADVDTTLMCNTTTSDADSETVTITYGWKVNGSTASGETDSTLSGVFARGDSITCSVTPTDGDATGTKMTSDALEISNALPSISSVTLSPTTAYEDSTLECTPSGASDPDGDSVSYGYEWYVEGAKVSGQTGSSLTGTYFSKGDSVYCKVTPNDGYDDGSPKSSSTVVIQNSAPSITAATISPDPAYADDDLTCSATGADDVDGDMISYSYVWYVNSNVQGETSNTLSSGFVGGDGVKCRITPSDGTTLGTPKTSSTLTISNTAPTMPSVSITPSSPNPREELTASPSSTDVDGDSLNYTYVWKKNGVIQTSYTSATLPADVTGGGETWLVSVTASDGTASSSAGTDSVTVVNDDDLDGYVEGASTDCDDDDPSVYAGADEIADSKDNDCDGTVDEGTEFYDDDGDFFSEVDGDCDDTDPDLHPNAAEPLDGVDNDCTGEVDDRWATLYSYGSSTDTYPVVYMDSSLALESDGLTHLHFGGENSGGSAGGSLYAFYDKDAQAAAFDVAGAYLDAMYQDISLWEQDGSTTEARLVWYEPTMEEIYFVNYVGSTAETELMVQSGVATDSLAIATDNTTGGTAGTDFVMYAAESGDSGSCTSGVESYLYVAARVDNATSFSELESGALATGCNEGLGIVSSSMAIDDVGSLHLSWFEPGDGEVMYRKALPGGGSPSEVVVANASGVGPDTAVAVEPGGSPAIAYFLSTSNAIKVATTTNETSFTSETAVSSSNMGGTQPSEGRIVLRFHGDGSAHLLFQAASNMELWYATDENGSWEAEQILTSATSLVDQRYDMSIDYDGNPRITYQNATDEDLYLLKGKTHLTTLSY